MGILTKNVVAKNVEKQFGRMETDIQMDGIQRNRWIDGLTDQQTDGLNGWIDIWQIDIQMNCIQKQIDRQRYRLILDECQMDKLAKKTYRQTD